MNNTAHRRAVLAAPALIAPTNPALELRTVRARLVWPITVLATIAPKQLAVIARTTAMHYKGSHKDVGRIARELNVESKAAFPARRSA